MNKYINDIITFLNDFKNRKGGYVFFAIITSKFLSFVLSIFLIKNISTTEFGLIAYAYNIISFVAPFAGFGIFQSLARFGPLQRSQSQKRQLFKFILGRGIIASALLIAIIILISSHLTQSLPESNNYLISFSFLIFSLFVFELTKIYYRIYNINKLFAYAEISHSLILFILGVVLTYTYGGYGYLTSVVISPLIVSVFVIFKHKMLTKTKTKNYTRNYKKTLWSYGVYTSLGGLTSKLIFSIDILTIGYLIKDPTEVALYKAASLIPFALLFIPAGFMKTDLVQITKNYNNKEFLKKYIINYTKLFTFISIILAIILSFGADYIVSLFGPDYSQASPLIPVFSLGIIGAFVFRSLFGNLLDAIGWAKTSAAISISILILDVLLNYYFVKAYGIIGAAYSTTLLLWAGGLVSFIAISKYLKNLD